MNADKFIAWLDSQENLRRHAERMSAEESWLRKGAFRRSGEIDQEIVEKLLDAVGLRIWDLYDPGEYEEPQEPPEPRRRRGKPTGVPARMTDDQIRAAHVLYEVQRLSLRAIGALLWEPFGYANQKSCAQTLNHGFIRLGLPRRERVEATIAAHLKHGRARRNAKVTDLEDYNAYRREQRRATGEVRGVTCAGVRTQHPRKGSPCSLMALRDSDYCRTHDPRFAEQIAADLAVARQRLRLEPEVLADAA